MVFILSLLLVLFMDGRAIAPDRRGEARPDFRRPGWKLPALPYLYRARGCYA